MAGIAGPSESSHLLVNTASSEEDSSPLQQKSICISCPKLKHLCLPSKAAILILLWTIIVGAIYYNFVGLCAALVLGIPPPNTIISQYEPLPYALLAIVMMFYPLSGFIADVCCGRLKTVVVSLIFLLFCWILAFIGIAVMETLPRHVLLKFALIHNQGILVIILGIFGPLTFIIGLAGYQANIIQLGLDQLFEAPSQYLGLFVHYAIWAFRLGSLHFLINFLMVLCISSEVKVGLVAMQVLILLFMIVLLLMSYWKRRWFHSEPGHQNPYSTVYKVLKFAKSHKRPLRRSAFTHCDNYIPSRLDFAKERFGGPFTTEQVENVKTFFRILLILFAIGPVFALEVPASYFIAPLFGMHFHHYSTKKQEYCRGKALIGYIIEAASFYAIPILLLFPMCLLAIYSLLRKNMLKIFTRLGIGIFFCLFGVVCLLVTDITGHVLNISNSSNQTQCVFQVTLSPARSVIAYSFSMHWSVFIPPGLFLGIGPSLVIATTLEFISAQSPQSMKGLLVGVFFAIRGLFQFLNSIVIIPLSLKQLWASGEMIEHPPVTNCGFVYLMLTSVTGLIGLILFSLAARRYKYRTRDEGMFHQQVVEDIYDRYISQAAYDYSGSDHSCSSCED